MNTATISIQEYDDLRKIKESLEAREIEIRKEIVDKYTNILIERNKEIEELKTDKRWHLRFGYEKKTSAHFPMIFYSASKNYTEGVDTPVELRDLEVLVGQIKYNLELQLKKIEEEQNKWIQAQKEYSNGSFANVIKAIKLFFTK